MDGLSWQPRADGVIGGAGVRDADHGEGLDRLPQRGFVMQHSCPYPQRTRPERSRQHQLQRRRPQRSRQQFRHLTKSRSPLGPLIALFASGTMVMADEPVVEAVASSSPANPIASATFDMRNLLGRAPSLNDSTPRASFVGTAGSESQFLDGSAQAGQQSLRVVAAGRSTVPPENQ